MSDWVVCAWPPQNQSPPLHTRTQMPRVGFPPAFELPSPCSWCGRLPNWTAAPFAPPGWSRCHCRCKGHYTQTRVKSTRSVFCWGSAACRHCCTPDHRSAGRSSSRCSRREKGRCNREGWLHWGLQGILVPEHYLSNTEKWQNMRRKEVKRKHERKSKCIKIFLFFFRFSSVKLSAEKLVIKIKIKHSSNLNIFKFLESLFFVNLLQTLQPSLQTT